MGRSVDVSSYLFRFPKPPEQLLLALAIHESMAPRVTAQDLYCWLSRTRRHPNLDWRWASEYRLVQALRMLRDSGLVIGSRNPAHHPSAVTWYLTRKGWQTLAGRCLFEPVERAA